MLSSALGCCQRPFFTFVASTRSRVNKGSRVVQRCLVAIPNTDTATAEGEIEDSVSQPLPALLLQETAPLITHDDVKGLWKAALKLPMYWVGGIPVMVGAAAGYSETGALQLGQTFQLLLGAICVIAWLNLSNDVFDQKTGVDVKKPESIMNLIHDAVFISRLSLLLLAVGVTLLGSVMATQQTQLAPIMLGCAILCGYLYQGPPFRWSYQGLGEPLCFVAFGPLATSAFYLILSGAPSISSSCWAASILVGLSTTLVLFCSHFHQYDTDRAAQKLSPVVRLGGAKNAIPVLTASLVGLFAMVMGMSLFGWLPPLLIPLSFLPAWFSFQCIQHSRNHLHDLDRLKLLKLHALDVHSSFGMALSVAFVFSRALSCG